MDRAGEDACRIIEKSVTGPDLKCLKPLKIGDIQIANRVLLAPMSGITDAGLRRIARGFGASLVVSEMVASDEFARGSAEATLRAEGAGSGRCGSACFPNWRGSIGIRLSLD